MFFLCKIHGIFFIFIARAIMERGYIFSDSSLCLGIINFQQKEKVEKGIMIIFSVFFWYRSDHKNMFHFRPISCLIQLLNCWWCALELCVINFRWPILFRLSRLNWPWNTLENCIAHFFFRNYSILNVFAVISSWNVFYYEVEKINLIV